MKRCPSALLGQLRSTVRASGGIDGNFRFAEGANLCGGRFCRRRCGPFDFYQYLQRRENDNGDNQEIQHLREKRAVSDGGRSRLGFFQCCVGVAIQRQEQLGKICAAGKLANDGHNQVVYEGCDDFAKSAADDYANGHVSTTLPFTANSLNSLMVSFKAMGNASLYGIAFFLWGMMKIKGLIFCLR